MHGVGIEHVADDGPANTSVADDEQVLSRIGGELSIVGPPDARLQRFETLAARGSMGEGIAAECGEGRWLLIRQLGWAPSLPSPHRNLAQFWINCEW